MESTAIKIRFEKLNRHLDERLRRLLAGVEALAIGRGGISLVSRETGLCRETIRQGCQELEQETVLPPGRVRQEGGGRKRTVEAPSLIDELERLIEPATRGDPESPLRWTCKSTRQLADALNERGHRTSHRMVAELLHKLGYSLQGNRKTLEGGSHPDRNAQFEHIYAQVKQFQSLGDPVISVDTKKKELVGHFKQAGAEWSPQGAPEQVQVHDFQDPVQGKVAP